MSVQTTEKYLGCRQRIRGAVNDHIGIEPLQWRWYSDDKSLWRITEFSDRIASCPYRLATSSTVLYSRGMELIYEIRDAEEGGLYARALGHSIFTDAETWDELRANVLEAVSLHFEDATTRPRLVQMHYVKDELVPIEAA
jgi:hypothetical protein